MKKLRKYILILGMFILMPCIVMAKPSQPSVEFVEEDLYFVSNGNEDKISYYLVGADIDHVDTYAANKNKAYISIPNGNYYVWAQDTDGNTSDGVLINVTNSCSNRSVVNATGGGTAERCFVVNDNKKEEATTDEILVTCAKGYYLDEGSTAALVNNCERKTFATYNLSFRYCKKVFQYKCAKIGSIENLKLDTLSISTGKLTPEFSATNYVYQSTTTASSVAISATLQDNSNSFVPGYGPRTVELNYGLNNLYVKTKSSNGSTVDYLIKLTRTDTRDANNRLSSLSIEGESISPSFNENTLTYNAKVSDGTNIVSINAELASNKASFVSNFGPRKVNLNNGSNKVQVKVRSESGAVRVYTINILRGEEEKTSDKKEDEEKDKEDDKKEETSNALLKDLVLSDGITFDPNVFDYNVVVDYDTTKIDVSTEKENEDDEIDIKNVDELEVGGFNEIVITVTSKDKEKTNTYTIYVERREENMSISNDSLLKDLSIDGYKIKFDARQNEYTIKLKEKDHQLKINATPSSDRANITVEGNDNLVDGSEIKIRVTAEDGSYTDYFIKIDAVKRHGNVFLTIFVVILIILLLAYLVLRAMGYKIVFNFEAVVDMIKNIFSKKE